MTTEYDGIHVAIGKAVTYLSDKEPFASKPLSEVVGLISGSVLRNQAVTIEDQYGVVGFACWGLVEQDKAEAWLKDRTPIEFDDCIDGDCMVINIWAANNKTINDYIYSLLKGHCKVKAVYALRFKDGIVRPVCLKL